MADEKKKAQGATIEECARVFRIFSAESVCSVAKAVYTLKSATVIEIKTHLGLGPLDGKVSNALKKLRELGVVTSKTEGKFMRYESVYARNLPWAVRRCVETVLGKRS